MMYENRRVRKILSIFLALALVFTTAAISTATVGAATVKPKAITLKTDAPKNTVDINGKITVSVKSVKPSNASKSVTWKSSNKKVATVTSKGVITGKKTGTVKITATSKANKKIKKTITVKVKNIKPSSVSLNKTAVTLYERDGTFTLKATVKPKGLYNKGVTYTSSNKSIAMVSSSGVITPKKVGTATITVKTKESGKTAKCTVTVKPSKNMDVLMPFVMAGYYAKNKLNYVNIASDADVRVWDAATKTYKDGKNDSATILGNYVQLTDKNKDKKADLIEVVKFKDGAQKWDKDMKWLNGAGKNAEPSVSDETGKAMYDVEYRIPMGERLLSGFGLGDYSGTTDFSNLKDSTYWPDYDYYNTTSNGHLTMLTGYKTQLQTTGWTCVLSSALSVLDWYGERGDLNEEDLAALRSDSRKQFTGATSLKEAKNVFQKLNDLKLTTKKWKVESSFDNDGKAADNISDPEWIKGQLKNGHPIMVIWNSYGGHGQVIIGYDDMGTKATNDDTLIMMDPYDTTDHNANGYNIQSFERLAYGLSDADADGISQVRYLVAYPEGWSYDGPKMGGGIKDNEANTIKSDNKNKLNDELYDQTKADLKRWYVGRTDPSWLALNDKTGLGGPAGIEGSGNYNKSPYYNFFDFYKGDGPTNTLDIVKNYKTIQQSNEWTCGCTSSLMVMKHFKGDQVNETDVSLSHMRQNGEAGPTFLSGMKQIFSKMNGIYNEDWVWFTRDDLTNPSGEESYIGDYCLQAGSSDKGLIPYLIKEGIPIMIGWDEWGGHWQTIIGYDDMDTPQTQDDVLVLADSYDTTDHDQDGYYLESFERLVYGWNVQFEEKAGGFDYNDFIVAFPKKGHANVIKQLGLN